MSGVPVGRDASLVEVGAETARAVLLRPVDSALSRGELLEVFAGIEPTGYLGSTVSTEVGGAGLTYVQFGSLVEGIGSVAPFLSNHSVQRYLHSAGTPEIRERWLPALLDGSAIGLVAITEPHGGSQVAEIQTELQRTPGGFVLRGTKTWVVHAETAHVGVVLARDSDGRTLRVVVDLDGPGVRRRVLPTNGLRYLSFGSLEFHDCPVPEHAVLTGDGVSATKVAFAAARALVAVQAVALAQRALEHTVRYLSGRTARERPVTSSDIVRHRVGEMAGRTAAARLLCYSALADVDARTAGCDAISAGAKALATDVARDVCAETVELCAGAGAAEESVPARCRNDASMLATADGTSLVNQTIWGAHVVRGLLSSGGTHL